MLPVPHQDSNETFQAITAAQRGREAADPLAKFLSDPTQVYLGDKDEVRDEKLMMTWVPGLGCGWLGQFEQYDKYE